MNCSICQKPNSQISCTKQPSISCGIPVHKSCYGLLQPVSTWICDQCIFPQHPQCCLCPPAHSSKKNTPLRKVSNSKWAHLSCALFFPQLSIGPFTFPIFGIDQIDPLARTLKCYLCGLRMKGVCVNCSEKTCNKSLHPQCALSSNLRTEPPQIFCQEHSAPPGPPAPQPLPAHKLRTPKPLFQLQQTRTVKINFRSTSQTTAMKRIPTSSNNSQYLQAIEDYFKPFNKEKLVKSGLPLNKNSLTVGVKMPQACRTTRVLIQNQQKRCLAEFQIAKRYRKNRQWSPNIVVQPSIGSQEDLSIDLHLKSFIKLTAQRASNIQLIGRCLHQSQKANDEVTRELLYCLEYFSRKVLPTVNSLKQLLSLRVKTHPPSLSQQSIIQVQRDSLLCIQWGFIFRNVRQGIKDKDPQHYSQKFQIVQDYQISESDCAICFNYDQDQAILNPLMRCVQCLIFVHKYCYGVHQPPENFVCDQCLEQASSRCVICTCRNGPMKKAGAQWFHISCALWDCKRMDFQDPLLMRGLKITGETQIGKCEICLNQRGLLTQCSNCDILCHLMCAWKVGYAFSFGELPVAAGVRKFEVKFRCPRHQGMRDLEVQSELRSNPFRYYVKPYLRKRGRN